VKTGRLAELPATLPRTPEEDSNLHIYVQHDQIPVFWKTKIYLQAADTEKGIVYFEAAV
jgi:hypothetical protein